MFVDPQNLVQILFLAGNLVTYFKGIQTSKAVRTLDGSVFLILLAIACMGVAKAMKLPSPVEGTADAE